MTRSFAEIAIEELLDDYPPPVRDLAQTLRLLVKLTLPQAQERPNNGWRAIGYHQADVGYLGGIFLHPNMVKLGFEHGAKLPDPLGLLKPGPSAGNQVRYLEIRDAADIDAGAIQDLLVAAEEFGLRSRREGRKE